MARKTAAPISQDELYSQPDDAVREELDDPRALDLDVEQESPFLRGQKRVSVRRGSLPKKTATRITWAVICAAVLLLGSVATAAAYHYGEHSWRFRVESSDDIEVTGLDSVTKSQVMEVMGGDIGRNIFFIPLAERQAQLEQIPWVESASVTPPRRKRAPRTDLARSAEWAGGHPLRARKIRRQPTEIARSAVRRS